MVRKRKSCGYTEDEVRKQFITYVKQCIVYWESQKRTPDVRGKLEGLAHSILVGIDGDNLALPRFILAPNPHPVDREYRRNRREKYYPNNYKSGVKCDISGMLHDAFISAEIEE